MLNRFKAAIARIGARMRTRYDCDRLIQADEQLLRDIGISRTDVRRLSAGRQI